jgi:hypothetical protein
MTHSEFFHLEDDDEYQRAHDAWNKERLSAFTDMETNTLDTENPSPNKLQSCDFFHLADDDEYQRAHDAWNKERLSAFTDNFTEMRVPIDPVNSSPEVEAVYLYLSVVSPEREWKVVHETSPNKNTAKICIPSKNSLYRDSFRIGHVGIDIK